MDPVERLRSVVDRLRPVYPYHYECAACERVFPVERETCTVCGGDVERVRRGAPAATGEQSP